MAKEEFFLVGNITNDLEPAPHLGGPVSYIGVTARRLGMLANVITKAPAGHPYLDELSELGIAVERLPDVGPATEPDIISFRNFYDKKGRRHQVVMNKQTDIRLEDLPNFPDMPEEPVVFVAPVIGEVEPELFPDLSRKGYLVVAPQGYFRHVRGDGNVVRRPWPGVDSLADAELVILSDEDLTFDEEMDTAYLDKIKALCPIVVLTRGSAGLSVFQKGTEPLDIRAFPMTADESISPTGVGDSCAAALTWHYRKWGKLKEAAVFGTFYPALKLMGLGGSPRGVQALPTLEQVKQFINSNSERFEAFLTSNGLNSLPL